MWNPENPGGMYRPWYTCVSIGQESNSNLDHRGDNLVCLTSYFRSEL